MHYRIKPGYSFRDIDGSVKTGGQEIDLDEQSAKDFNDRIEPIDQNASAATTAADQTQ